MKKALLAFMISGVVFTACNSENKSEQTEETKEVTTVDSVYGESFSKEGAISVDELVSNMSDQDSMDNIVLEGELSEVCQKQGCWVKLKNDHGEDLFVKFRGHSFFAPKDAAGSHVFVNGKAVRQVTPVDELKHYAEDKGESDEVIAAITEPKEEIMIDASGIIIQH